MADCNALYHSQMEVVLAIDNICLSEPRFKWQLILPVGLEELKTKNKTNVSALLDSGCVRTCVDKVYAREQKWPLQRIQKPIQVQYVDGSSNSESTI
jgi:hypothetical protein